MKKGPFDYVKSINKKTYETDLSGYMPYLTNRAFAMHVDTVLLAEEMNQMHYLGTELQYDFYYYAVRKGDRFGFPQKPHEDPNLEVIIEYFQCSKQKALEYLRVLSLNDISKIISLQNKGGNA